MNIIETDNYYFGFAKDTASWGIRISLDIDPGFHNDKSYDFTLQFLCFAIIFGFHNSKKK